MNEAVIPLLWLLAMTAALPLLVFYVEVWLCIRKTRTIHLEVQVPSTCILIPAYDEAKIITQTLVRLGAILVPSTRVVVVADTHLCFSPHVWWQR